MSLFDIVCLTSLWEGIPRVLIQGAKIGKPLIAFDIDGNSEVIKDEINGFLIPPLNIQAFAQKVLLLLSDENLRQNMSHQSKLIIDNRWDKEIMLQSIEQNYFRLTEKKNYSIEV